MSRRLPALRNAFTIALLLCALALRVAIPTGYMLDRDANGWPKLIVCPAAAPAPMAPGQMASAQMAMSGSHMAMSPEHHRHEQKSVDHPCAFAAASAAVDLAVAPHDALVPHARTHAAVANVHLFARPGLGLAAPPPPQTGPPAAA